jgi:predicted RNase H-like nuclease (RuvC/YqgF family)
LSLSEALREQETTEASAERNDLASSTIYDAAAQPSHGGRPCTKLDRAEAQVKEYKAAIEQYQQEQDVLRREVEKFQGSRNPATLEAELAQCRRWQAEWRRRAEKAEAALAHISDAKGAKMFQLAKHKFAEKYHPDKAQGGRLEKQMYHEIFTDIWSIFNDIEKGKLA